MSEREHLLESIASTIADYHTPRSAQEVDRWVKQFREDVQLPILIEMDHVLKKTYQSKEAMLRFLRELATSHPASFWRDVRFLNIQQGGQSQAEMLRLFDGILQECYNLKVDECGKKPSAFVYLDDAVFTGNRLQTDLSTWIINDAPAKTTLHIITMARHTNGHWYANDRIVKAARKAKKTIDLNWYQPHLKIENRLSEKDNSDVLWPTVLPADERTTNYIASLAPYTPELRRPGHLGPNRFFSSEEGRHILEQEFLVAGLRIRAACRFLNQYQRPLGYTVLNTLGCGSLFVTYRNCPNNCPLALWAGDPWPLFPRKTN